MFRYWAFNLKVRWWECRRWGGGTCLFLLEATVQGQHGHVWCAWKCWQGQ